MEAMRHDQRPAAQEIFSAMSRMAGEKKVGIGTGVLILKGNSVLLGKRHSPPYEAGTWTMPGGKMEYGESFEDTARRETLEETGITLKKIELICLNNDETPNAHFVTIGFLCKEFEGEPRVMEPDKVTDWQWFTLDKLPSPMFMPSARIVENYQKNLFYIPR
jgi:8-oxo-dGTP diphosphatase